MYALNRSVCAAAVFAFAFISLSELVFAAPRPATEEDLPIMTAAGYQNPKVGASWDPNDPNIGKDAGEAKQFLLSRYKPNAGGCSRTNVSGNDGIMKLNPGFAIRLAKALKQAPGEVTIISAYRNAAAQQCANPKVKGSNHSRGCAVDLGWNQNSCSSQACQWFLKNGPSTGVHIRMKYSPEWNHIEPVGDCSASGPGDPSASSATPLGLGNTLRQAMGLDQPTSQQQPALPAQPAIPPQPAMPPQTMGQQQQPTQYFQQTPQVTTNPSTVAQTGPTVGTPSSLGSSGNTVAPIGSASSQSSENTEEKDSVQDRRPSIGDQLLMLAYGTSSIASPTEIGKSMPIVVSEKDASKLKSSGKNATSTSASAPSHQTGETTARPTQTFISGDLAYEKNAGTMESRSQILAYLADLKARLLQALEMLRPFGLRAAAAGPTEFSE